MVAWTTLKTRTTYNSWNKVMKVKCLNAYIKKCKTLLINLIKWSRLLQVSSLLTFLSKKMIYTVKQFTLSVLTLKWTKQFTFKQQICPPKGVSRTVSRRLSIHFNTDERIFNQRQRKIAMTSDRAEWENKIGCLFFIRKLKTKESPWLKSIVPDITIKFNLEYLMSAPLC